VSEAEKLFMTEPLGGGDATGKDVRSVAGVGEGTAACRPESVAPLGVRPVGRVAGTGGGRPLGGFRPGVLVTSAPSTSSDHRDGGGVDWPKTAAVRRAPAAPSTSLDRRDGGGIDRPEKLAVQ